MNEYLEEKNNNKQTNKQTGQQNFRDVKRRNIEFGYSAEEDLNFYIRGGTQPQSQKLMLQNVMPVERAMPLRDSSPELFSESKLTFMRVMIMQKLYEYTCRMVGSGVILPFASSTHSSHAQSGLRSNVTLKCLFFCF